MIILFLYIIVLKKLQLNLDSFYNNVSFFIIIFCIYNLIINDDKLIHLRIHKYNTFKKYLISKIFKITINSLCLSICIFMINCFIFLILKMKIDAYMIIHYSLHLFIIFEIYYLFMMFGILIRKFNQVRTIIMFVLIFSFLINNMNLTNIMSINIFKFYLYMGNIFNILLHYSMWFYICYLFIDSARKKINI